LAAGCIVNSGATIDHDCQCAEGVHVCPGAHLAGDVRVGARTWFGIGAVAKQGIRIGADVTVGAGAVCLRDVRDGVTVVGVPAREMQR
jgi:acetyltransferase-like isoleucine patch superfamily enzyme